MIKLVKYFLLFTIAGITVFTGAVAMWLRPFIFGAGLSVTLFQMAVLLVGIYWPADSVMGHLSRYGAIFAVAWWYFLVGFLARSAFSYYPFSLRRRIEWMAFVAGSAGFPTYAILGAWLNVKPERFESHLSPFTGLLIAGLAAIFGWRAYRLISRRLFAPRHMVMYSFTVGPPPDASRPGENRS